MGQKQAGCCVVYFNLTRYRVWNGGWLMVQGADGWRFGIVADMQTAARSADYRHCCE